MENTNKDLEVKTGLSPEFAKQIVITDIDCKECVLDLIDNSVDSAIKAILKSGKISDTKKMPTDYSGYEINIGIQENRIYIEDTCFGIEPNIIEERLLLSGKASDEPLSIGHFGVGLKRALLKLGNTYHIETKHGNAEYIIECNADELTDSKKIVVAKYRENTDLLSRTQILISDFTGEAKREIVFSSEWESAIRKEIGIRYSLFLQKGLIIKYNNILINHHYPGLKEHKAIKIQRDSIEGAINEIKVDIEVGLHEKYKHGGADTAKENEDLTEEYGWYFVCNDRVIKKACIDPKFGWAKKWHPEYYGFIGWVYFTGSAKYLPWNTKKTDIDPNSEVFCTIKDHLKTYASKYRSQNREVRKKKDSNDENQSTDCQPQIELLGGNTVKLGDQNRQDIANNQIADQTRAASNTPSLQEKEGLLKDSNSKNQKGPSTRIDQSLEIVQKLQLVGSQKLSQLYSSLCGNSLVAHPVLMSIGAWAFFEILSKLSGAKRDVPFNAYLNSKLKNWFSDTDQIKLFIKLLNSISGRGNLDKHDTRYYTIDARQLIQEFSILEPLLIKILDEIIEKKKIKTEEVVT